MTDVFISYKREDRQKARAIAEALAKTGLDVWWDIELLPGQRFADEINAVIDQAKAAVVLWTPKSIASHWVIAEAAHALKRDILVPAWIEHVELPVPFNTLHTLDLTKWNSTPTDPLLEGLIAGIQRLVGRPEDSFSTRSQSEIETALAKPAHEVEFWTSVSKKRAAVNK
ncbi:toll/interleukin-1 receptor domain-containing protein [Candidatus Competibacter phosphatis]|uniref:Toll/interleukin-1 receptor domain-containing protein n=1 Tax=Candidatus Competibacter phosphatis TaxID=221280 RepID=A0ABX1TLT2_9GAMM|nr:toll/interleukin-1 receptor domain-containing protein [Candidatus Competibacter phosphatis]NMQ19667.1 toll/interleukin-1 receptor domain-containing protein [Candidatus Competibacter phosphatis]